MNGSGPRLPSGQASAAATAAAMVAAAAASMAAAAALAAAAAAAAAMMGAGAGEFEPMGLHGLLSPMASLLTLEVFAPQTPCDSGAYAPDSPAM